MSLELEIKALITAINTLTAALNGKVPAAAVAAPVAAPAPAAPAPAPVAAPTPVAAAPAAPAAPAMPAFAMPMPPAAAPAAPAVPFSDAKGMLQYLMTAYQTMGPVKGAAIQGVLTTLGVGNVNDVRPDQYAQLHAGVEALRATA